MFWNPNPKTQTMGYRYNRLRFSHSDDSIFLSSVDRRITCNKNVHCWLHFGQDNNVFNGSGFSDNQLGMSPTLLGK